MARKVTVEDLNSVAAGTIVGLMEIEVLEVGQGSLKSRLPISGKHLAPIGWLHSAAIVALADTSCAYGCGASLPEGADSFTTIELKANFLGTLREGEIACEAKLVHGGRTTQVWDATVRDERSGKTIALFRCTQLIIYPRPDAK